MITYLQNFTQIMKTPMNSEKVKEFRRILRLSQQQFALKLGVSTSTVGMLECGKLELSKNMREKIKEVFSYDIDKEMYITEKEYTTVTSNIIPIPYYEVKAAANPRGEVLPDYPEKDALYFDKRWLQTFLGVNPYNCSIIKANGDSMDSGLNKSDDIKDGDLLLVDNSKIELVNNKTFIVEIISTSELLVKKVVKDFMTGKVLLISNNEKYPPRELTEADNAIIVGRVMWNGSKENF